MTVLTQTRLTRVLDRAIEVERSGSGPKERLEADWVVLSLGLRPPQEKLKAWRDAFERVTVVGRCGSTSAGRRGRARSLRYRLYAGLRDTVAHEREPGMAQATPPQRKRRIPRRLRGLLLAVVIVGMILLTLALLSLEFGPPEQNAE